MLGRRRRENEDSHFGTHKARHRPSQACPFRKLPLQAPNGDGLTTPAPPAPMVAFDRHVSHAGLTHQFALLCAFQSRTHTHTLSRHRRDDRSPARRRRHEKTGMTSSGAIHGVPLRPMSGKSKIMPAETSKNVSQARDISSPERPGVLRYTTHRTNQTGSFILSRVLPPMSAETQKRFPA